MDTHCEVDESDETNNLFGPVTITVQGPLPETFPKVHPANGVVNFSVRNSNLAWQGYSVQADSFEYCLDTTDNDTCDTAWNEAGMEMSVRLDEMDYSTTYYWQVRARNGAGVTEADSGEWWNFTTQGEGLPDYTIVQVSYEPAQPAPGQAVGVTATVKNIGTLDIPAYQAFTIQFYLDHEPSGCFDSTNLFGSSSISSLDVGDSLDVTFHLTNLTPGQHEIWVLADSDCDDEELNETNNLFGPVPVTVQSGLPDLVVQSINWVQDMPGLDQPVGFTVRVKNQGQFTVPDSQEALLNVYLNHLPSGCGDFSGTIYQAAVPPLPAGGTLDLLFSYPGFSQPGAHQIYSFIDTGCQVAETDESNNILGPVEVDVLKYLIFKDGFESGDTSAWSNCQSGGSDLAVTPDAALTGSYGLGIRLDNKAPRSCTAKHALAETRYQARFLLDPNSLGLELGNAFTVFQGLQGGRVILQVELRWGKGHYQLRISALEDGRAWRSGQWISIQDGPQEVEFYWRAATGPDRKNGSLSLWIDGSRHTHMTNLDNHTRTIDRIKLGAVEGVDRGTTGTLYLDDFVARRDNYPTNP